MTPFEKAEQMTTKPKRAKMLSDAARLALQSIGTKWQKVPHHIRAAHIAVMIRHGYIEHRWPFDLYTRMMTRSFPWLREGEIRRIKIARRKTK
jgi:hypothetical protein